MAPLLIHALTVTELRVLAIQYQDALLSIAHNSCCAPCQEAALVARLALGIGDKEYMPPFISKGRGYILGTKNESTEEITIHPFNSRTPYEPGDDRDIWCKDCEYHRDNAIHALPAIEDDDPSTVPEGTGDTWKAPLRKPVRL